MCIYAGICRELFLIKALYQIECGLSRIAEFLVAFHLQRREIKQVRRRLRAFLLRNVRYLKGFSGNVGEGLFTILLVAEPPFDGREQRVAINRGEHPIRLGLEAIYLFLALNDKCQRGSLHATDT